jgi:hypothetical protein
MHSSQSSGLSNAYTKKPAGLSSRMRNSTVVTIGDAALVHLTHNFLRTADQQPRTYLHCPSSLLALMRGQQH